MFESHEVLTAEVVESMISEQIEYFKKFLSIEMQTMKNQKLESMRDELFHIMKLKNKPISEKVKTEIDEFHSKCVTLSDKLYNDMHERDKNNMTHLMTLKKDVFYKE